LLFNDTTNERILLGHLFVAVFWTAPAKPSDDGAFRLGSLMSAGLVDEIQLMVNP
jgi:hypothetical protein